MDSQKQNKNYSRWIKFLKSFVLVSIVYLAIIRPTQAILVARFFLPFTKSFLSNNGDLVIAEGNDAFLPEDNFFIFSKSNAFPGVIIDLPLNGWFWLAMAFVWPSKNRRLAKVIWIYSLSFFVISPVIIFSLAQNFTWVGTIAYLHGRVYRVLFLALGVISATQIGSPKPVDS